MSLTGREDPAWTPRLGSEPGGRRRVGLALTVLVLLGAVLMGGIVYPFASALVFAAVLAGAVHPQFERLSRRLGHRRQLAAGIVTAAVVLLLIVPVALLIFDLSGQIEEGIGYLRRTLAAGGLPALVQDVPAPLRPLAERVLGFLPRGADEIKELAGTHGGEAAMAMSGVVIAASSLVFQVAMMVVAFFFFLVDGPALVDWVASVFPLPSGQTLEILTDFRNVSVAVLMSSFATAGVQSVTAGAGYLIGGAPQPLFFTLLTFVIAFVPALGATSVVLLVALLVFLTGHSGAALFLVLWGVAIVGTIDNLAKPLLMKGRMEIHGGLIFFALVGGFATFGPVGLVAGPLVLSFFLAVVRIAGQNRPSV